MLVWRSTGRNGDFRELLNHRAVERRKCTGRTWENKVVLTQVDGCDKDGKRTARTATLLDVQGKLGFTGSCTNKLN